MEIKKELSDTRNIGKTLNNLGEVYFDMGDFANSIEMFNQSIEIKEKLKDIKGQVSSCLTEEKPFSLIKIIRTRSTILDRLQILLILNQIRRKVIDSSGWLIFI